MSWYEQAVLGRAPEPAHAPPVTSTATAVPSVAEPAAAHGSTLVDYIHGAQHEGLAGMLDPRGMTDRAAARRELAPMFTVRAAGGPLDAHTAAPNTITPAELDHVARMYSDIRLNRGDLHVSDDNTPEEQQASAHGDTMHDIANILQTESGRRLIGSLTDQKDHHQTTISYRHHGMTETADTDNAEALLVRPSDEGRPGGADTNVTYVPGDAGGIVRPNESDDWLPMRSDVTLYHELTHAMHMVNGTMATGVLTEGVDQFAPGDVGKKRSEYQAVGAYDFADGRNPGKPDEPGTHITENDYRNERLGIAGSGVGVRTTGGVSDADMVLRDTYCWHPR